MEVGFLETFTYTLFEFAIDDFLSHSQKFINDNNIKINCLVYS